MYERYRGSEVNLFGKGVHQKDPYALTLGINYTPIPLFTLGAEYKTVKEGRSDSRINLQLNYQLGRSWQSHFDPSEVADRRTLAGSRTDLVERNNNIVLDHRKQQLIQLTLPSQVVSEATSTTTVTAQVESKYGVGRIEWDAATLIAAGGSLAQVSPYRVTVTLPEYQAASSNNNYQLTALAYDVKGNASPKVSTQVVVTPNNLTYSASMKVLADGAPANGIEKNTVQMLLVDADGLPVAGQPVSFTSNTGAEITVLSAKESRKSANESIGITGNDGTVTLAISNAIEGVTTINASLQVDNIYTINADADVVFVSPSDLSESKFSVTSGAAANGKESNILTAELKNADGEPVVGRSVTFEIMSGAATPPAQTVQTNAQGIAIAGLVSTVAGNDKVTATAEGYTTTSRVATFVADESTAIITSANLVINPDGAVANGIAKNGVTATVTDAKNNLLEGEAVVFTVDDGATISTEIGTSGKDGIATASVVSKQPGTYTVTASVNNNNTSKPTTFIPAPKFKGVLANGYAFDVNAGFPRTGFTGAAFTLATPGAEDEYTWNSSTPSWVQVDSHGKVAFIARGNSSPVTITATPKLGGASLTYTFTVRDWFINSGRRMEWKVAENWCSTQGASLPVRSQITQGNAIRGLGTLWSEWGDMRNYSGSITFGFYWTSELFSSDTHYFADVTNGRTSANPDSMRLSTGCLLRI